MCGIAGFVDYQRQWTRENLVQMTDTLRHRGPDGSGYQVWNKTNYSIGFGHRRLSIIDLSEAGHQPMNRGYWHITYNGEVYNFGEIRTELQRVGHTFNSTSDTEVILAAFQEWGTAAVQRFNGMFAFAIFNEKTQKLWLFRDRTGVKPLYIYQYQQQLAFASELKAIHQLLKGNLRVSKAAVGLYFKHGRVPTPHCIYENCFKLKQGSFLEIDLSSQQQQETSYWNVFDYVSDATTLKDEREIQQEVESLLTSSFNYRMVADVPVGVFLSGGYDSSLVTALLQKDRTQRLKTFTIGFENKKYDESNYAEQVAQHLGTDHHSYLCTEKEAKDIVPILPEYFDEPFGDSSAIPTYLVSQYARRQVTVALSADGGDEQFVGYQRYLNAIQMAKRHRQLPKTARKIAARIAQSSSNTIHRKISHILHSDSSSSIPSIQTWLLLPEDLDRLLTFSERTQHKLPSSSALNSLFATEYIDYLQDDIMVKVDRAAMSVSLEGREPLLDYRIAEYVMQLPLSRKYKKRTLKYILKNITHQYIPKSVMERPKHGFGAPVNEWLREELRDLLEEVTTETMLLKQGLFNLDYVMHRKKMFYTQKDNSSFIWHLFVFQLWYEKWVV
jgi:asparagine synthase (glutamine-hydrolysing)